MQTVDPFIKQKFQQIIELFLPAQCLICKLPSNDKLICSCCQTALLRQRACCQHCGLALNRSSLFCGDCLKQAHLFTQLHAIGDYQKPYSSLIKKLKYTKQLIYGELLGELLTESVLLNFTPSQIGAIDYILPVPLHAHKHRHRGFNQSEIIAGFISKKLTIPLLLEEVERQVNTEPQEGLSLHKRKNNLKRAFSIDPSAQQKIAGAHIVIVDDVVTTGATVNSLCHTLLTAGAQRIDIWCVCRTPLTLEKTNR